MRSPISRLGLVPHKYSAVTIISPFCSVSLNGTAEVFRDGRRRWYLWASNLSNGFHSLNNFTAPIDESVL